jgi:hypothetical protein
MVMILPQGERPVAARREESERVARAREFDRHLLIL